MEQRAAGITSNTIPWEILRAAGYAPVLLEWEAGPTPHADRYMEDVFDPRFRVIFDRLVSGAWSHLYLVAIPRTSEQEHKLFLYLREAQRMGEAARMPKLYLYNLPHMRAPESRDYGLGRTRQMTSDLNAGGEELGAAIQESNRARRAIRSLLELRKQGRVEGSDAVETIRGFYCQDRSEFTQQLEAQIRDLERLPATTRPRVLIKGAPLDHTRLHRAIEDAGGYVVAEDDWRGSRAAGNDIAESGSDPVAAIFEKYFYDAPSPRVFPPSDAHAWFEEQLREGGIDAVVFYMPLTDDVAGWEYPQLRQMSDASGVRSALVRESAFPEASPELRDQLGAFLTGRVGNRG